MNSQDGIVTNAYVPLSHAEFREATGAELPVADYDKVQEARMFVEARIESLTRQIQAPNAKLANIKAFDMERQDFFVLQKILNEAVGA